MTDGRPQATTGNTLSTGPAGPADAIVGHVHSDDLPWVEVGGVGLQVLRVSPDTGVWVVRNRFQPGYVVPTHRHTGPVHGYTLAGRWRYREYGTDYTAGTFIFEPANSVHTLVVPQDNTEVTDVLFVIEGANLDLGPDGEVVRVIDGSSTLAAYYAYCEKAGLPRPEGILR